MSISRFSLQISPWKTTLRPIPLKMSRVIMWRYRTTEKAYYTNDYKGRPGSIFCKPRKLTVGVPDKPWLHCGWFILLYRPFSAFRIPSSSFPLGLFLWTSVVSYWRLERAVDSSRCQPVFSEVHVLWHSMPTLLRHALCHWMCDQNFVKMDLGNAPYYRGRICVSAIGWEERT